jgi:uncharacterized protein YacL
MFGDISNFNNIPDYLSILNGSLLAELIIIIVSFYFLSSNKLKLWYSKYKLSAVIADTFILVIGVIIARLIYKPIFGEFNIIKFIILVLIIQIIHDILFFKLIIEPLPRGTNHMIDLFKDYADEVKGGAILGDSIMIVIAVLFSSIFAKSNININIVLLIIFIYLTPYIINAKNN